MRDERYEVLMPKVGIVGLDKTCLDNHTLYLVLDTNTNEQSTIMVVSNDVVVWFDQDGYIGHSGKDHLMEDRYNVVRAYKKGDKLIVTIR